MNIPPWMLASAWPCREAAQIQPKPHVLQTGRYGWFLPRPVTKCLFVVQADRKARLVAGKMQHLWQSQQLDCFSNPSFSLGKSAVDFSLVSALIKSGSLDVWKDCQGDARGTRIMVTKLTPPGKVYSPDIPYRDQRRLADPALEQSGQLPTACCGTTEETSDPGLPLAGIPREDQQSFLLLCLHPALLRLPRDLLTSTHAHPGALHHRRTSLPFAVLHLSWQRWVPGSKDSKAWQKGFVQRRAQNYGMFNTYGDQKP